MERWTFGVDPVEQTKRAAALMRRITGLLLSAEGDEPAVDDLIAALERADAALAETVPVETAPRVGDAAAGDGRVYLDHARDIGAYNPSFPVYSITVDGPVAKGTVAFPIAYEGPPGLVHGGFLGVFFDSVVQHHNCDVGVAGKTTSLTVRFRRPTPLLTTLDFVVERAVAEDRIRSTARLLLGDKVLCEADVDAIAGDRANLPAVGTRRSGLGQ